MKNNSETQIARMKELNSVLNEASRAYYQGAEEIMSNYEYDRLYDELKELEIQTGIVLASSPTVKVGYEVISELPKESHDRPMLSLDKTKSIDELEEFLGENTGIISWKLDGLTIVLTYEHNELVKAVTRGNGIVGEVITPNARAFINLPGRIPFDGKLVLRGEAVISYSDFNRINESMPEAEAKYKNPRNLCSGSVRQKNSAVTAERSVQFHAFSLVEAEGVDFENSRNRQFKFLREQGFSVVEHYLVNRDNLREKVEFFSHKIESYDIPSDGLVLTYEDLEYSASLGTTAKYPRDSFAFKWQDETARTFIKEIEWSASRTGLINPVAIFDPVELEGTTVSRASLHNLSILESLQIGIGDEVSVYKANMIIPQIEENYTRSSNLEIPDKCPVCGGTTRISRVGEAKALYCTNEECPAKKIKRFALFVSRDAMNIAGLSEATLEKFISGGFIREFKDLYHLDRYRDEICAMEGFGEKSYNNLIDAIEKSRATTPAKVLFSLGIPNVGLATAKTILKGFGGDLMKVRNAGVDELSQIESVGSVIAEGMVDYFSKGYNNEVLDGLLKELNLEKETVSEESPIKDKTFVITGSVVHFKNRNELKSRIESLAGKVASSVSKNTDFLINNDSTSGSSKNKKAAELGIPVITEEEFLSMINEH